MADRTDLAKHSGQRSTLCEVVQALCCVPREDACCTLALALLYVAPSERHAQALIQKAQVLSALSVGKRWELGHRLIRRLVEHSARQS
jgi:hypothetical protein